MSEKIVNVFYKIIDSVMYTKKRTILISLLVGAICLPPSILLYSNLKSGLEELLPKKAKSIKALEKLHERLGDNLQLTLFLSGEDKDRLHIFADQLADKVSKIESGAPRFIDYKPSEIQNFLKDKKGLFIDLKDLQSIENKMDKEIKKHNPFSLGLLDDDEDVSQTSASAGTQDNRSIEEILEKYKGEITKLKEFPSGYYDGDDGKSLVMIFYPSTGVSGYENCLKFRNSIGNIADKIKSDLKLNNLSIQFTGDVESIIQEQKSLQADLMLSSIIVVIAESILIIAYFGWAMSFLVLGIPLSIGTLITFAISYFAIGSVNASTAFLGSIIVGNGVNAGIILLARYLEERKNGAFPIHAMKTALKETSLATFIASFAAAIAYASLMFTAFRGYSQFGFMGGIGMSVCWIATYLLVPPLAIGFEKYFPYRVSAKTKNIIQLQQDTSGLWDRAFGRLGKISINKYKIVVVFSCVIAVIALVSVFKFAQDPFEYDTTKLRSKWATQKGGYLEVDDRADSIVKRVILPVVVLTKSRDEADEISILYKNFMKSSKEKNEKIILGDVMTLDKIIPTEQSEKIEVINKIRNKISDKKLKLLDKEKRDQIKMLLQSANTKPFTEHDLPEVIQRQFRETDGSIGKMVLLFPTWGTDTRDGRNVLKFAKEVRSQVIPETAVVAGSQLIFADLLSAIAIDGPLATLLAFIAVFILSLYLARGTKGTIAVTFSLLFGILITAAVAAVFNIRVNFLNFIALPITFGIGLDYAANVYGRFRRGNCSKAALFEAVSSSGGAVAVCSLTTTIGYASLLVSRNGALFSFGILAIVGEIACLFSALILLPAILALSSNKAWR